MEYAILIARQRSGTGALGSMIDKHPQLKYLGEVFHPGNAGQEQNYFTFLKRKVASDPAAALPDRRYGVFLEFLEEQAVRFPNRRLIVDIKYRSLHHLDHGWRGLVERPTALATAIENKVPLLHLTRRNALHSFVSGRLAEANKVWHANQSDQIKVTSTVLNIRQLSRYIVGTEREIALIEEWTRGYGRLETFDYDEMFDAEGLVQKDLADRLSRLLQVDEFTDRAPSFVKQAPSKASASIENYDLVKRALLGSTSEWMLDS